MPHVMREEQLSILHQTFKAEKRKKVAVANALCKYSDVYKSDPVRSPFLICCYLSPGNDFDDADASARVTSEIFPELKNSSDIFFREPSKKALRRIPANNPMPEPLSADLWTTTSLTRRIARDVAEVADTAMRKVPVLTEVFNKGQGPRQSQQTCVATLRESGMGDRDRRLVLMRDLLANRETKPRPYLPGEGFWEEEKAAPEVKLPGAQFWKD